MAYGSFTTPIQNGYGKYTYKDSNGKNNTIHLFKTNPLIHGVSGANTSNKIALANHNPPATVCSPGNVLCKTNGNYLDSVGGLSFYGVWYAGGVLSKEGMVGLNVNDPRIADYLGEEISGWVHYCPALCIKKDGSARIHWFSAQSGGLRTTVAQAVAQYDTIISGQHCLVHQSKSVFANHCYSFEGVTIANWNNLNDQWNHHTETLGGYNSKINRARTFFGHAPGGACYLICVEGDIDWGAGGTHGMKLDIGAQMMVDLGCDYALNMDGGSPSQMRVNGLGKVYATQGDGFPSGSAVCAYLK